MTVMKRTFDKMAKKIQADLMIELDNRTALEIDLEPAQKIAEELTDRAIELIVCDDETIRELNREHRGIDRATDVLSFPYEEAPMVPLGSIVISADFVRKGAKEHAHGEKDEFTLLFLHGLLHLLGYDHETDAGQMRRKEKDIIERFDLPKSLIVRTEEA